MNWLEHRIPPPVIALVSVAIAWALTRLTPALTFQLSHRLELAIAVALIGFSLDIWALLHFRRARTTFSPTSPQKSSALVQGGPYRFTRNPMYLGLAIQLVAVSLYLGNPLALIGLGFFLAWITRFQIRPEERVMAEKFGEAYRSYRKRVRRWL